MSLYPIKINAIKILLSISYSSFILCQKKYTHMYSEMVKALKLAKM